MNQLQNGARVKKNVPFANGERVDIFFGYSYHADSVEYEVFSLELSAFSESDDFSEPNDSAIEW